MTNARVCPLKLTRDFCYILHIYNNEIYLLISVLSHVNNLIMITSICDIKYTFYYRYYLTVKILL